MGASTLSAYGMGLKVKLVIFSPD